MSSDGSSDVSDDSNDDVSDDVSGRSSDVSDDSSDDDADGVTTTGDHMTMKFKMGKRRIKLEFERNKNIPKLPYYYTAEKGGLVQWILDQEQVQLLTLMIDTHNYGTHLNDRQIKYSL